MSLGLGQGLCLKGNRELGEVREDSNLVKSLVGKTVNKVETEYKGNIIKHKLKMKMVSPRCQF